MARVRQRRAWDQSSVRQRNLSVILNRLREEAPISRAALAEITGLNKTTVSSLVQELIESQFVREIGIESSGVGRPAVLLDLNPLAGYIISAEIGVDFISVICTDFGPDVIWSHREAIDPTAMSQRDVLERLLSLLDRAKKVGRQLCGTLLGISVGVPGLVDEESGTLLYAPNLRWRDVPVRALLSSVFEVPLICVDNEANMAALGEYYFGVARGYDEVLYISAGVGLGGGIVRNGHLVRGASGFAGEFGHMTMDPDGEPCNCGNRGCWETQVSQAALFRYIRRAVEKGHQTVLLDMVGENLSLLTVPMVVEAARTGDSVAVHAFEMVGRHLGIGIASLVNALNPELVVFGGILSLGGEFLLPLVNEEVERRALRWNREATRVVLAQHGFDACVMGGVAMVYQAVLANPRSLIYKYAVS